MMQDLAMLILDIANNAIRAKATEIRIDLLNSQKEDRLELSISDNGCGMSEEMQKRVIDPFYTTRTTRKVGLGVAFFKGLADQCEGEFFLQSRENEGTCIGVRLKKSHWDTPPLGNLAETMISLIQADESIEWIYHYQSDKGEFNLETSQIKAMLEGVSLLEPEILIWIKEYIEEQTSLL